MRAFPRPGAGHSRSGAGPAAEALLARMREVGSAIEELRGRQRALLRAGHAEGLEILAMARALGVSRQTAYNWLAAEGGVADGAGPGPSGRPDAATGGAARSGPSGDPPASAG